MWNNIPSLRVLPALCLSLVLVRASAAAQGQPTQELPLVVRFLCLNNGAVLRSEVISLEVAVRAQTSQRIERVVAQVNGQPVAQANQAARERDLLVVPPANCRELLAPGEVRYRLSVSVPAGAFTLAVRVEAAGGGQATAEASLRRELPHAPDAFIRKPHLYMLAIGVSQYQDRDFALAYPAKDAADLADAFEAQHDKLYSSVQVRLLTDQEATKAKILDGLEWLQRQTTAHDVAVLFMAGHGINDPSTGRYHFLPFDADLSAVKRSMVSQEDLQSTLRAIPGKAVVFLDTCHAGNLMGAWGLRSAPAVDAFVSELNDADGGVTVLAAAGKKQAAKESAAWGNGVFTKAVLEGLDGGAAYLPGRPITISMLDLFVSERVKTLTNGIQTATTARPSSVGDFPIAVPLHPRVSVPPPIPATTSTKKRTRLNSPPLPLHKRWWLWTAVGGIVAGGIVVGAAVGTIPQPPADAPHIRLNPPGSD